MHFKGTIMHVSWSATISATHRALALVRMRTRFNRSTVGLVYATGEEEFKLKH